MAWAPEKFFVCWGLDFFWRAWGFKPVDVEGLLFGGMLNLGPAGSWVESVFPGHFVGVGYMKTCTSLRAFWSQDAPDWRVKLVPARRCQ